MLDEIVPSPDRAVFKRRWFRIIPTAFVMYTIAYIDRTNVSMALPAMVRDLHMTPVQAGGPAPVGISRWR